ncbi:MAG: hypothetical protein K5907_08660, partial [Treponema sp.]|nr:hypothetical protein [Treponema sp.]
SSGRGIYLLDKNDKACIKELVGSSVLLEEYINQNDQMKALNPSSVNSLRVYTLITDNQTKILSITLRVGGGDNVTDNFHTGGVAYPVDVELGIVCGAGRDILGNKHLFHPSSNMKMLGFEIPKFEELKDFIYKASRVFTSARLIAWDVAITNDGFEMIEGNYNGNPDIMQSPTDTGMRKFIKKALKRG